MAETTDPVDLLDWLDHSLQQIKASPGAFFLKNASDAANYVHRLRSWSLQHDRPTFDQLSDVVHGLSYVRGLIEHHYANTVETVVTTAYVITSDGARVVVDGVPVVANVDTAVWRSFDELPSWPKTVPVHQRDEAFKSALEGKHAIGTLEAALAELAGIFGKEQH